MRVVIVDLCRRADVGDLTVTELAGEWPAAANASQVLREVRGDIESAIEHLPGRLFGGGIDWAAWRDDENCIRLNVDMLALKSAESIEAFMEERGEMLEG